MADGLDRVLESREAERLATGFAFTEGPLWHPDGFYYFVDIRKNNLHRIVPGKPAEVDFYSSTMKVELSLLHEGDLLAFLADLRASGRAYYAPQRCALSRTGQPPAAPSLQPRLRASCAIDLITIVDRGAKG